MDARNLGRVAHNFPQEGEGIHGQGAAPAPRGRGRGRGATRGMARGRGRGRANTPAPAEQPPVQEDMAALMTAMQQRLAAQEAEMQELRNELQQRMRGPE